MITRIVLPAILASLIVLFCAATAFSADDAVSATACKRLQVYNSGLMSNNTPDASLDFIDDCDSFSAETDASIYLNIGTPILTRIDGSDTLIFHMYDTQPGDSSEFLPVTDMVVDSTSFPEYTFAMCEVMTADSTIGCIIEYYAPKDADTCQFIIQKFRYFVRSGSPISNLYLGGVYDWNVPSDTGARNGSSFDLGRNTIYQHGVEYDTTGQGQCPQLEDDRYAGVRIFGDFKNATTFDNATYIDQTGPYGNLAPLPRTQMYELMWGDEGFSKYSSGHPDSTYIDMTTLVTFGGYDLMAPDTIEVVVVLVTGKDGLSEFQSDIDEAAEWAEGLGLVELDCCDVPGDSNGDGVVNIGDAVHCIARIFIWPPPVLECINEGDANGDCALNVGDCVYIITHIFKGGAPPVCGCID